MMSKKNKPIDRSLHSNNDKPIATDNKAMVNTMREVYDAQLKLKNKNNKKLFERLVTCFEQPEK